MKAGHEDRAIRRWYEGEAVDSAHKKMQREAMLLDRPSGARWPQEGPELVVELLCLCDSHPQQAAVIYTLYHRLSQEAAAQKVGMTRLKLKEILLSLRSRRAELLGRIETQRRLGELAGR